MLKTNGIARLRRELAEPLAVSQRRAGIAVAELTH
jgi:hypothetical protein